MAEKWAAAGHKITFGVRDQSHFKREKLLGVSGISVSGIMEAVAQSEIVLVATPAIVAVEVAQCLGDTKGKVIVDTMNIVGGRGPQGYSSTAHALQEHTSGEVIKAFSSSGFNNIKSTAFGSVNLDMFSREHYQGQGDCETACDRSRLCQLL